MDREKLHALGRKGGSALRLHDVLQRVPVVTIPRLVKDFAFTAPTANAAMRVLIESGVAHEITGFQRNRVFAYQELLDVLNQGTEPLR